MGKLSDGIPVTATSSCCSSTREHRNAYWDGQMYGGIHSSLRMNFHNTGTYHYKITPKEHVRASVLDPVQDISACDFHKTPSRACLGFDWRLRIYRSLRHQGSGVHERCQQSGNEDSPPLQGRRVHRSLELSVRGITRRSIRAEFLMGVRLRTK